VITATLAVLNCTTLVLHHLLRNFAFSACCFFFFMNGSVWLLCVIYGPIAEFLGGLAHVPVLAFYLFGYRAGVSTLALTLGQAVIYTGACLLGTVPTSGTTLRLGLMAQMFAAMGSILLLGLCAALNERSRARATHLYQEAHARLAKVSRHKARFLANASHDLRTPIHSIMAASQELMAQISNADDDDDDDDEVARRGAGPTKHDLCSIIVESSYHMLGLINDLLDFERMESHQMQIEDIPFDLACELTKTIKMLEATARQKHIALSHRFDVQHRWRLGDALRFRQILVNLTSNALKFTPEGGTVQITATTGKRHVGGTKKGEQEGEVLREEDQDLVTISVQDSGIGISQERLPFIFNSFTQADISTTRQFGGSGLGLAICKRLCRLMGGHIGCSSSPKGSLFWFTLPLPPVKSTTVVDTPISPVPADDDRTLCGLRPLLVEDNKVNQMLGRQMLIKAGCRDVVVAKNGEEGVRVWENEGPFDVVLMDCHMPIMDGFEATRRIRQREQELGHVRGPIIALSASSEADERAQGAAAGMDDWLVKPFNRQVLVTTILRHQQSSTIKQEEEGGHDIITRRDG